MTSISVLCFSSIHTPISVSTLGCSSFLRMQKTAKAMAKSQTTRQSFLRDGMHVWTRRRLTS